MQFSTFIQGGVAQFFPEWRRIRHISKCFFPPPTKPPNSTPHLPSPYFSILFDQFLREHCQSKQDHQWLEDSLCSFCFLRFTNYDNSSFAAYSQYFLDVCAAIVVTHQIDEQNNTELLERYNVRQKRFGAG